VKKSPKSLTRTRRENIRVSKELPCPGYRVALCLRLMIRTHRI
jgi:hypothetical protein